MAAELRSLPVLVTGATGFIGRRLAECLVERGAHVRVLVRDVDRLSMSLREHCEIAVGDLTDADSLRGAVRNVGVIFHCAGNVATWSEWDAYYAVNVQGVTNILQAIQAEKPAITRFVHISSVDVYGFPVQACDETCETPSGSFGYGETKRLGELQVRTFCEDAGIPYAILRPCNVIGPRSPFVSRIGDALRSGVMLKINRGNVNAGLLYVDNLVKWLIWASEAEVAVGQVYNVRDAYDATWGEFIERLRDGIHGKGLVVTLPYPVAEIIAHWVEAAYRILRMTSEPFLHRLLVRIFGRTCGHSSAKIHSHGNIANEIQFADAIDASIKWYLSEKGK
jgi:nucleoside-diphosphate-sugar epimerase